MHLNNISRLMTLALTVVTVSGMALAQPAPSNSALNNAPGQVANSHGGHRCAKSPEQCKAKRAEMRQKFKQELGLSDQQEKQIHTLRKNFYEAHKSEFAAKRAQWQEIKTMKQNGASQEQIAAKRKGMKDQFSNMKADREKLQQQIRATLTPEQAQKFDAMKAQHRQHWEERKNQQRSQ